MSRGRVFCRSSFPLYCARTLGEHHILVAGGGGHAKSGVPNRLVLYGVDFDGDGGAQLVKVGEMDTGTRATMNMDVCSNGAGFLLALGQDSYCSLVECAYSVARLQDGRLAEPTEKKRKRGAASEDGEGVCRRLGMEFYEVQLLQTDFKAAADRTGGPYQKVVRFAPCGTFFATGGSDGHFRLWAYPSMQRLLDRSAHKDDVDDLDVSKDSKLVLSVGRNGNAYLWRCTDGSKLDELHGDRLAKAGVPDKYRIRFARFVNGGRSEPHCHLLLTCSIPVIRNTRKQACYLTLWRVDASQGGYRCSAILGKGCGCEVASAMQVSQCGEYAAFGTLGGSVMLTSVSNLRIVKLWPQAHSIFVTSVDFLPCKPRAVSSFYPVILRPSSVALVSVSADNFCQLHVADSASSWSWPKFFLLATVLLNILYFLSRLLRLPSEIKEL